MTTPSQLQVSSPGMSTFNALIDFMHVCLHVVHTAPLNTGYTALTVTNLNFWGHVLSQVKSEVRHIC